MEIIPESMMKEDDEGNTHQRVIAAVERMSRSLQPGRQAAIQIVRGLRQLRKSRVQADYYILDEIPDTEVPVTLGRSERMFELCADVERLEAASKLRP